MGVDRKEVPRGADPYDAGVSSADAIRIAALLPAYEVGEEFGRGAFGRVYAGRHRALGRNVAIKLLPGSLVDNPDARRRFVTEAQLAASFDHPHIVSVHDFVESEEVCLLVMERLTGGTLWDRFSTTGLRAEASCAVVIATADALHYAHQRGVLHRDIKPENLLFTGASSDGGGGTVKVTDFGIAKVLDRPDGSSATALGSIIGTPAYMAPEQCLGQDLSPATDVFALGVVLYELLSGFPPFVHDQNPLVTLQAHAFSDPVPLIHVAPDVPREIAAICMAALQRRPEDRIGDGLDLAVSLAEAATRAWGDGWMARGGVPVRASDAIASALNRSTDGAPVIPTATPVRPTFLRMPGSVAASDPSIDPNRTTPVEGQAALAVAPPRAPTPAPHQSGGQPGAPPAGEPFPGLPAAGRASRSHRSKLVVPAAGFAIVLLAGGLWFATRSGGGGSSPGTGLPSDPSGVTIPDGGTGILIGQTTSPFAEGIVATDAVLVTPEAVAFDPRTGGTVILDSAANQVRRVDGAGKVTTVAGSGRRGFAGDGAPAADAALSHPRSVAVDTDGTILIADTENNRVRRVDPATGIITTIAGNGDFDTSGDSGPALNAKVNQPIGLAIDVAHNLYVVDGSRRVRRIDATTKAIDGFAGSGEKTVAGAANGDGGPAASATFTSPGPIAVDRSGNVFVVDGEAAVVRRVDGASHLVKTFAGTGKADESGSDGKPAAETELKDVAGVAVDASGNVLVSERSGDRVRRISPDGTKVETVGGNGGGGDGGDGGPATEAQLSSPSGLAVAGDGSLLVADQGNAIVRRIDLAGKRTIDTVAGRRHLPARGKAAEAVLQAPGAVVADAKRGGFLVADPTFHRVLRVTDRGEIVVLAGNDQFVGDADGDGGPAIKARLVEPTGLAVDRDGNVLIADSGDNRIRIVNTDDTISTFAGTGENASGPDGGDPRKTSIAEPRAVLIAPDGAVLIAEAGGKRVRRVVGGRVETIAGGDLPVPKTADGSDAAMVHPVALAFVGNDVLVADDQSAAVFRIHEGSVTVVAGTSGRGLSGDGAKASEATLSAPAGLAVRADGTILIADRDADAIRTLGVDGRIGTLPGGGRNAALAQPGALLIDGNGVLLVSELTSVRAVR